ncbi:MAG: type III polyketide synthase [Chloroflexi bacterium]|nr:type III polyketide synthase [Chloroflexota bacterium]
MGQIIGIGTSVPENYYEQDEIADYFVNMVEQVANRRRAIYRVFESAGVSKRHMVVNREFFYEFPTTRTRNDFYMEAALPLGKQAIQCALDESGYTTQDIDDLVVVSCTGFSIPGLDLQLAHQMNMRPDLRRSCILGMGCYGAFPGLLRAFESASAHPDKLVLVLSVELCSLHFQIEPTSENVVSTSLFSDGAAAILVGGNNHSSNYPRILDSATHCDYQTLDKMSFNVTDFGFQMYLSSYVPDILAAKVEDFVDNLLERNSLEREDIDFWGIHPGSRKIVQHIQSRLNLRESDLDHSLSILNDYGNMSSATILFVLEHIQRCGNPQPGDRGILLAFGPGLTMEGLLVQW